MLEPLRNWLRVSRATKKRWIGYIGAVVFYLLITSLPLPSFEPDAQKALAVFGVAAFLWGTHALPLPVTAVLILFLLPVSGAMSSASTYEHFGNSAVFFILGAFILSSPIVRSGLSSRIAFGVVSRFGRSQNTLLGSILVLGAILSCVISAHAVAAMLFPIVLEVVRAAGVKPGGRFGLAAFLAMAWGVIIGSNTTLLGGARGPLAIGILQNTTGQSIGFGKWMSCTVPLVLIMLVIAYSFLVRVVRGEKVSLKAARRFLEARNRKLGTISQRELVTAGIMLVTITLWIAMGDRWGLDTVAFLGVSLAFMFGVADWREVQEDVNWGVFIMYGSAITLSAALEETGAASGLTQVVLSSGITSGAIVFAAIVAISLLLTEFVSNSAAVAVLMPVALAIAEEFGASAQAVTMAVTIPAGLGFMLPVSTPAIAIAVSSGYVRPLSVLRWGVGLDVIGCILLLTMSRFYWPLVGLGW